MELMTSPLVECIELLIFMSLLISATALYEYDVKRFNTITERLYLNISPRISMIVY